MIYRKFFHNENYFSTFTPESCYWAGFIAADGCVYKNSLSINLKIDDIDHLYKFKDALDFTGNIQNLNPKRNACLIKINSKKIVEDLKNNFNVIPNKSIFLAPPNLPQNLIRHFIRGFLDGDGCYYYNNKTFSTSMVGTKKMLIWIKDNIRQVCDVGMPTIFKITHNSYRLEFNRFLQNSKIIKWLYDGVSSKYYLYRKFVKSRQVFLPVLAKEAQEKLVVDLYKSGKSINYIAKNTIFKYYRIYRILTESGIKIKNTQKNILNNDEINQILNLREQGFKIKDIAKQIRISHTKISTFLHFYKNEDGDV